MGFVVIMFKGVRLWPLGPKMTFNLQKYNRVLFSPNVDPHTKYGVHPRYSFEIIEYTRFQIFDFWWPQRTFDYKQLTIKFFYWLWCILIPGIGLNHQVPFEFYSLQVVTVLHANSMPPCTHTMAHKFLLPLA